MSSIIASAGSGNKRTTGLGDIWGFPKIRGTFLGVPIIRILVFRGLYWGPPIWGNYHIYIYIQASKGYLGFRVRGYLAMLYGYRTRKSRIKWKVQKWQ